MAGPASYSKPQTPPSSAIPSLFVTLQIISACLSADTAPPILGSFWSRPLEKGRVLLSLQSTRFFPLLAVYARHRPTFLIAYSLPAKRLRTPR